jgi:hypothetical protein
MEGRGARACPPKLEERRRRFTGKPPAKKTKIIIK